MEGKPSCSVFLDCLDLFLSHRRLLAPADIVETGMLQYFPFWLDNNIADRKSVSEHSAYPALLLICLLSSGLVETVLTAMWLHSFRRGRIGRLCVYLIRWPTVAAHVTPGMLQTGILYLLASINLNMDSWNHTSHLTAGHTFQKRYKRSISNEWTSNWNTRKGMKDDDEKLSREMVCLLVLRFLILNH